MFLSSTFGALVKEVEEPAAACEHPRGYGCTAPQESSDGRSQQEQSVWSHDWQEGARSGAEATQPGAGQDSHTGHFSQLRAVRT